MKTILIRTMVAMAIVMGLVSLASAQRKYAVTKTIAFKAGESTARIVGTLPNNIEIHEYHFRARGGQRMKVDLVSNDKNISFYIMTIPDGYVMTTDVAVRSFDDTLPDTGEYKLLVSTDTRRGAKYALEIEIEPEN